VELVALAGYMRLITRALLDAFPNRIINVHPSLLPAFPGLNAQRQAIEYGVKLSGCTVHFVTEGVDAGAIILQAAVPIREDDTDATLADRILAEEHRLLPEALQLYAQGRLSIEGRRVRIAPPVSVVL
jgi:phosphoribosylglycinamide formyltransferase-1